MRLVLKIGWQRILWSLPFLTPLGVVLIVHFLAQTPLNEALTPDLANLFLTTVAQVLAGILAIVFSVSVLAISIASDRYTTRIFRYFSHGRPTILTGSSFLAGILIATIASGVQTIPLFQWAFLLMVGFFAFCLLFLVYYFRQTLNLLDPRNLALRIRDESLHSLSRQNAQGLSSAIQTLGDIAVNALARGENETATRYLDTLHEIQLALLDTQVPDDFLAQEADLAQASWGLGFRSPVVDQHYRMFRAATAKKEEEITRHVAHLLSEAIDHTLRQPGRGEALKGILGQYQDFLRLSLESHDNSRFSLVRILGEMIVPQPGVQLVSQEYLRVCLDSFNWASRIIIAKEDFDLWRHQLYLFSQMPSLDDQLPLLQGSLSDMMSELDGAGAIVPTHQERLWSAALTPLAVRITPSNKRLSELIIGQMVQLAPDSDELRRTASNVLESIHCLWITTAVLDTFFGICVFALYQGRIDFIKELWRHVNPPDADTHWVHSNMVHFSAGFLTHQLTMFLSMPLYIEDFHGAKAYVSRYYLLCLAYALQQRKGDDWKPTIPSVDIARLGRDSAYKEAVEKELKSTYVFLVNLAHHANKALAQYDTIASTGSDWDSVFDGSAFEALQKARAWLEDRGRRQEWADIAESIAGICRWVQAGAKATQDEVESDTVI